MVRGAGHRALRRGRFSEPGRTYLVTTVTHARRPLFLDLYAARSAIAELKRCQTEGEAESLAWVLMPDHLHWLVTLTGCPHLARLMQRFKSRSAIAINRCLGREGKVWQSAYHDHGLRRDEDLQAAARYLVGNPLRAGLVEQIGDYPHWDAVWVCYDERRA